MQTRPGPRGLCVGGECGGGEWVGVREAVLRVACCCPVQGEVEPLDLRASCVRRLSAWGLHCVGGVVWGRSAWGGSVWGDDG